ncbi:hypothetical protein BHM03_00026150 [Ensete ventricosum]|nr:hypothetical protein BHM03_00026150 [Ensete ventricosum]
MPQASHAHTFACDATSHDHQRPQAPILIGSLPRATAPPLVGDLPAGTAFTARTRRIWCDDIGLVAVGEGDGCGCKHSLSLGDIATEMSGRGAPRVRGASGKGWAGENDKDPRSWDRLVALTEAVRGEGQVGNGSLLTFASTEA